LRSARMKILSKPMKKPLQNEKACDSRRDLHYRLNIKISLPDVNGDDESTLNSIIQKTILKLKPI